MKRSIRWTILFFALTCAVPAFAQTDGDAFRREVLQSIDVVPDRAALDAIAPDTRDRLERAAEDTELTIYERHRAITLLSFYPDSRTRAFFVELTADAEPEIRRMAWYSLARTFGMTANASLVAALVQGLSDDEARVREWVVRGLRWVAHPDAVKALERVASGDNAQLAKVAERSLRRHVANKKQEGPVE